MLEKIKNFVEPNRKLGIAEQLILVLLIVGSLFSFVLGYQKVNSNYGKLTYAGQIEMVRDEELEDYDEDSTVCDVTFVNGDKTMILTYSYEDYEELEISKITAYEYVTDSGVSLCFDHQNPGVDEISNTYKMIVANNTMSTFNMAIVLFTVAISLFVVYQFST